MRKTGFLLALACLIGMGTEREETEVKIDSEKIAENMEKERALSEHDLVSKKKQKKTLGKNNRKNRGRKR